MTYITRLTERKAMSISHIMVMVLTGFVLVLLQSATIQAQWTTNGNNINNTNTGNVGIGTTTPANRLVVTGDGSGIGQFGNSGCGNNYVAITLSLTTICPLLRRFSQARACELALKAMVPAIATERNMP